MRQNDSFIYIKPLTNVYITLFPSNGGFYEIRVIIGGTYYWTYVYDPYIHHPLVITYTEGIGYNISYRTEEDVRRETTCIDACWMTEDCDTYGCFIESSRAILF